MLTLAVALGMATSSYGQHSFTPEDIVNGGQLYRSNCVSGKLLNQDTFAIQILDYRESLKSVSRSNVRDVVFKSPMPSYREKLSPQELADVVSYLATLKGQTN